MPVWLAALLPIFGLALGVGLQDAFTRRSTRESHERELRTRSDCDYLAALAAMRVAGVRGDREIDVDAFKALLDAKTRMTIYGGRSVIQAAATLHKAGLIHDPDALYAAANAAASDDVPGQLRFEAVVSADRTTRRRALAFLALFREMRRDSLAGDESIPDDDVLAVLWRAERPDLEREVGSNIFF